MYDVFERYRVEEKNPDGNGTGIWKLPKYSSPQWAHDIVHRFHVMDDDKVDPYIAPTSRISGRNTITTVPERSTSLKVK